MIDRIKKSVKTNWWLFTANKESKTSVLINRIILLATPPIIGIGIALALYHTMALFPLIPSIIAGLLASFLVGYYMVRTSPETEKQVHTFLSEEDLINLGSIYQPSQIISDPNTIQPSFYQGVGEWMAPGHVPIKEFIQSIKAVDRFVDSVEYEILEDTVEYSYAVNTYSPRTKSPAIRISNHMEPESYPITRLKAPYDNYVTDKGFPTNLPPIPALPSPTFDIPDDQL